jgi:2-phospho-L-lactate guanylyltransferase
VSLVLPVKATNQAKSRLALPRDARRHLALSLAYQSLGIATACLPPGQVYVVTSDPNVGRQVMAEGANLIDEGPVGGLNRAAELGLAKAAARSPEHTVVVMVADLPELTADALRAFFHVIQAARDVPLHVADSSGVGTTMVASPPGFTSQMVFGRDSSARFGALGYRAAHHVSPSLRTDLDTLDDLLALTPAQRAPLWERPRAMRCGSRSA